jgi:hypothetical protein
VIGFADHVSSSNSSSSTWKALAKAVPGKRLGEQGLLCCHVMLGLLIT